MTCTIDCVWKSSPFTRTTEPVRSALALHAVTDHPPVHPALFRPASTRLRGVGPVPYRYFLIFIAHEREHQDGIFIGYFQWHSTVNIVDHTTLRALDAHTGSGRPAFLSSVTLPVICRTATSSFSTGGSSGLRRRLSFDRHFFF